MGIVLALDGNFRVVGFGAREQLVANGFDFRFGEKHKKETSGK
jgi:hypothetical protein